jgi:hypothetical protein
MHVADTRERAQRARPAAGRLASGGRTGSRRTSGGRVAGWPVAGGRRAAGGRPAGGWRPAGGRRQVAGGQRPAGSGQRAAGSGQRAAGSGRAYGLSGGGLCVGWAGCSGPVVKQAATRHLPTAQSRSEMRVGTGNVVGLLRSGGRRTGGGRVPGWRGVWRGAGAGVQAAGWVAGVWRGGGCSRAVVRRAGTGDLPAG